MVLLTTETVVEPPFDKFGLHPIGPHSNALQVTEMKSREI